VVVLCLLMVLRRLVWRSGSLVVVVGLLGLDSRRIGHVLKPPMGGVRSRVRDIREGVTIHYPTNNLVRRVVVDDTLVRFDLSNMVG
jgi:hypothetical protein